MTAHQVALRWQRRSPDFDYQTFDRTHTLHFSGGQMLQGSASPVYLGNPALTNPEEVLIASLSSCFMLTFLSIAARKRLVGESYEDEAECELGKNAHGKTMISRIVLRPKVVFDPNRQPDPETLAELYRKAEENCFVSNSLRSEVAVAPR
jgi:organic hydroperoxide reductase OsmC/OhrA